MTDSIQVTKRDRSNEPFDVNKIIKVVQTAGMNPHDAAQFAATIAQWAKTLTPPISSLQIRDKVLEELKKVNFYAASLFEWYEKTKE